MKVLQKIKDILVNSSEVGILTHQHPDGDALGSQIALSLGLKDLGIKTFLINKDPVPENLKFLPGSEEVKTLSNIDKLPEVVIFVDCANLERTGFNINKINNKKILNIDHHISNNFYGDLNWVDGNKAATGEMIYQLLNYLKVEINKEIATCLYTAISTDTGSFMYDNTTSLTHQIASELIKLGADTKLLRINFYENMSKGRFNLLKKGLNKLSFTCNDKVAWITLNQSDFLKFEASDEDSEGLINYIKNINGVEIAIVFKEIDVNKVKVSFRSKNSFDVNELALLFGGGGHSKAAGCTIEGKLDEIVKKVIEKTALFVAQGGTN